MKTFTKLMAMTALLVGGSLAVSAQAPVVLHDNPLNQGKAIARVTNSGNYDVKAENGAKLFIPKRQAPAKAEEGKITAKIRHNYDPARFEVFSTVLYDVETRDSYWLYNDDSIASVPAGKYDIFTMYSDEYVYENGELCPGLYRIFVKEQVDIDEGTEVETDPLNTNNPVDVQIYLPNGELAQQSTYQVDADGNQQLLNQGNIAEMYFFNHIVDKKTGQVLQGAGWGGNLSSIWVYPTKTYNKSAFLDFFVSPLSDRFMLITKCVFYNKDADAFYHVYAQGEYAPGGVIANDPTKYAEYIETATQTLAGKNIKPAKPWQAIAMGGNQLTGGVSDGWDLYFTKELQEGQPMKYYVNTMVDGDRYFYPIFNGGFVDGAVYNQWVEQYSYGSGETWVCGPSVMQNNDGNMFYVNNGDVMYRRYPNDKGTLSWPSDIYPGCPVLSYDSNNKDYSLGSGCPIQQPEFSSGMYMFFNKYYGRAGEKMNSYNNASHITLKVNGEVKQESTDSYYMVWSPSENIEDVVEFCSTNENIEVDGLPGKSVVTFAADNKLEDNTAPMLTMLDFVNAEGVMTDRFTNADEATLRFYAGDFNVGVTEKGWYYYECSDMLASVEVSYSPYGQEAWQTIEVEEDPNLFYLPALGQFFSGSLAGVTTTGEKGWCDLKIRLTDGSGNWQEQIISPAFRIGTQSSVNAINVNSDATVIGYYDLQGRRLAAPAGVTIVRMSDGTARKVMK